VKIISEASRGLSGLGVGLPSRAQAVLQSTLCLSITKYAYVRFQEHTCVAGTVHLDGRRIDNSQYNGHQVLLLHPGSPSSLGLEAILAFIRLAGKIHEQASWCTERVC
jgi:hypothetical protein